MSDLPEDIGILISRTPVAVQGHIAEIEAENNTLKRTLEYKRVAMRQRRLRIAELEAVVRQLSRDPEMADEYVLAQINIENKARIAELESALTHIAFLKEGKDEDAWSIARKALEQGE